MTTAARKPVGPRARRAPARAWAREVVGDVPLPAGASRALEDRLTAYASHVVANACLKVRTQEGAGACRPLLDDIILSAAHVASGASGDTPQQVLRDLADALDEPLDPTVRERANA